MEYQGEEQLVEGSDGDMWVETHPTAPDSLADDVKHLALDATQVTIT